MRSLKFSNLPCVGISEHKMSKGIKSRDLNEHLIIPTRRVMGT